MTTQVFVNGYQGRMGSAICQAIENDAELNFVGGAGRSDDLSAALENKRPDVVVDVTSAEFGFENTQAILNSGCHAVIGTTGFTDTMMQELSSICSAKNLGCIIAPNFSIGAVLLMRLSEIAAPHFDSVEIIERHGLHKKDSPSGTAVITAEKIAKQRQAVIREADTAKELIPGARGALHEDVTIHSVRLPGSVAHQTVTFGGEGETLTLQHDSINRDCFMPGVLLCCKRVTGMNSLVYGIDSLLFN